MATFVLVPGAWLGGWAWNDVAARLRAAGHDVYAVTLTGLGERVHLARPEVDLETHIADVVNTIRYNDLDAVYLAGHSYAGVVVTGVADRIPERLAKVIFVDSAPLADGMSMLSLFPPEATAGMEQAVQTFGAGWKLPFPGWEIMGEGASLAGLSEEAKLLAEGKTEAQPWASWTRPLRLENPDATWRGAIIACDDVQGMVEAGVPEIVPFTQPPWQYILLETGHWPMFSAPAELTQVLCDLAEE